jgi:hypothetical protein
MNATEPTTADELVMAVAELFVKYHQAKAASATPAPRDDSEQHQPPLFVDDSSAPWYGLTGSGPTTNMTPSAELGAKMQWLASNLPGGISMRQLVLDATEKYVNELIAMHYNRA